MAESDIYLTVGNDPKGSGLLAIMTEGHPQRGDANCTVLTIRRVKNHNEAQEWFRRMKVERPWESRN